MPDAKLRGDALSPRVKTVAPRDDYTLLLTFSNGERRVFDAKPLFAFPALRSLENPKFFRMVQVSFGSVAWPNEGGSHA